MTREARLKSYLLYKKCCEALGHPVTAKWNEGSANYFIGKINALPHIHDKTNNKYLLETQKMLEITPDENGICLDWILLRKCKICENRWDAAGYDKIPKDLIEQYQSIK